MAASRRFALVDSLRAVAALSVLAFHAAFASGATESSALRPFVFQLDVGVVIFFLISGFVLYRPFARAHLAGEARPATLPYAVRRIARIVPAYWVALTVVVLWLGLSGVFTAGGVASYYGFAQIYRPETFAGGMIQAWSLCVEMVFYAFLPLYAVVVGRLMHRTAPERRLRGELVGLALLFAAGCAWNVAVVAGLDSFDRGSMPWLFAPPAFLTHFAAGMALAVLSVAAERGARIRGVAAIERWPLLPWAGAAAAFLVLALIVDFGPGNATDGRWIARNLVGGLLALCLLLPAVFVGAQRRGAVRRLLGSRLLLWLGAVSYGIYLYHLAVVEELKDLGVSGTAAYPLLVLLAAAGAAALAALSHRVLERPIMRRAARVGRRRPAPQPAAEPAVAPASPG